MKQQKSYVPLDFSLTLWVGKDQVPGQALIYIPNEWCNLICPNTCSAVWAALESIWDIHSEFCNMKTCIRIIFVYMVDE